MTKTDLSATATGLPTRRTLLAALPAVGFAPAAAAAGLPDLDPEVAKFAGAEERIRQFAEWFDLEVPPIEYDPEDVAGGPLLTDELFAWISDNGASFDWIFCGDAKGMATAFRRSEKNERRARETLEHLTPEETRGLNLAMSATIERGVPIKEALAIFDEVAGARVGVTA